MGDFNRGGNRGGGFRGGNGGGRPSFGGSRGGDRGPVTMHKAVCDQCHKSCEVPFRPSSDKPIYCNECFGEKRGQEAPRRDFNNDRGPKKEWNNDRKPSSFSKPVVQNNDEMKNQLKDINIKLDRLLGAIEKLVEGKKESKPVVKVAPVVAKIEVKKAGVLKVAPKKVIAKAPAKKVVAKKKK